jgi:hypothetical protein
LSFWTDAQINNTNNGVKVKLADFGLSEFSKSKPQVFGKMASQKEAV